MPLTGFPAFERRRINKIDAAFVLSGFRTYNPDTDPRAGGMQLMFQVSHLRRTPFSVRLPRRRRRR